QTDQAGEPKGDEPPAIVARGRLNFCGISRRGRRDRAEDAAPRAATGRRAFRTELTAAGRLGFILFGELTTARRLGLLLPGLLAAAAWRLGLFLAGLLAA